MSQSLFKIQLPMMIVVGALTVGLVAWKEEQSANPKITATDTVPKKERKIRNLDDALEELDRGQAELEKSMKKLDRDIEVSIPPIPPIPSIDIENIKVDAQKALQAVEPEKLKLEIEQSLKSINEEEVKEAVAEVMKEVNVQQINAQVQASLAKVDMDKIKQELAELKVELPKLQVELSNLKPQIEGSLRKAKVDLEKAKSELKEYKEFEAILEKDGLINRNGEYSIEHKEGKLYINGVAQPEAVYNKYKGFLEKHKNFKLKKSDDDFQLENH